MAGAIDYAGATGLAERIVADGVCSVVATAELSPGERAGLLRTFEAFDPGGGPVMSSGGPALESAAPEAVAGGTAGRRALLHPGNDDSSPFSSADPGENRSRCLELLNLPPIPRPTGQGVVIAVPDTGVTRALLKVVPKEVIEMTHEQNLLEPSADPIDLLQHGRLEVAPSPGHGTSVISAIITNPTGHSVGVICPRATIRPYRVTTSVAIKSRKAKRRLARAVVHAADRGAHIISLSLGTFVLNADLGNALAYAVNKGVIVVAAGGQVHPDIDIPEDWIVEPAGLDWVVGVGACDYNGRLSSWSARGPGIDIVAPVEWIPKIDAADPKLKYGRGTSFGTTVVAGAAALWLETHKQRIAQVRVSDPRRIPALFQAALANMTTDATIEGVNNTPDERRWGYHMLDISQLLDLPFPEVFVAPPAEAVYRTFDRLVNFFQAGFGLSQSFAKKIAGMPVRDAMDLGVKLPEPEGVRGRGLEGASDPSTTPVHEEFGDELIEQLIANPELFEKISNSGNRLS